MNLRNEKKRLPQNREKRIERKIETVGKMKSLLNRNKSEKKKKIKNVDRVKELEIELVKMKKAYNPDK